MAFTSQQMQDSAAQVAAMRAAHGDMKRLLGTRELDVAQVDKLADEMEDLRALAGEVQDALGRTYDVPDDVDEADLLGELDALEAEMGAEGAEAVATGSAPSYLQDDNEEELPSAPEDRRTRVGVEDRRTAA
jgi:charged multivesicular body protein 5